MAVVSQGPAEAKLIPYRKRINNVVDDKSLLEALLFMFNAQVYIGEMDPCCGTPVAPLR